MTMGVQELYARPLEFAESDPEWFRFTMANLRGEYVDDSILDRASKE